MVCSARELRSLFVVGTAAGLVLLSLGFLRGTSLLQIVSGLQMIGIVGAIYSACLPVVLVVMLKRKEWSEAVPQATLVAGILLFIHVLLTAVTVELTVRQPFLLDLVPFPKVMATTINLVVPSSLVGFLITLIATRKSFRPRVWVACAVLVIANLCAILYGYYLFDSLLDDSLATYVWWM